jgi:superfamily II DNA or RNA helicase
VKQESKKSVVKLTVTSDCLLTGVRLATLEFLKKELTIDNPKYVDAVKYGRWVGKRLKPKLKFYSGIKNLRFPRGFANEAVRLVRQLEGQPPEIIDQRTEKDPVEFSFSGTLRPYQQEAVQRVTARQFGVLESGTGSGKTVMALAVIADRAQPTLILVHNKELLYQWHERIQSFLGLTSGLVGDGRFDLQDVTVAIVNTARKKIAELQHYFGHLIVDECHRVPSSLFTDVVVNFDCLYMLGLSATAFRRDGLSRLINIYLGDLVHRVDTKSLEALGAVLRPELIVHETSFYFRYRDNYQDLLKALTCDEPRNNQIADDVAAECRRVGSGILVVSDRVAHCELLVALLQQRGVDVRLLTGRSPAEERQQTVEDVRAGQVQVLVSTLQLIGEGFDCPGLVSLFLTTPIKFSGRLLQVVGRILRPAQGKTARVHDYVDGEVGVLARSADIRRQSLDGFS